MRPVSTLKAFFFGLPSVWNKYLLIAVLVGLAAVILWPVARAAWYRLRSSGWQMRRDTRIALRSGLCVLLAYIFLVGPEWFNNLAQASIQYSDLTTLAWGAAGDTIEYGYDANGSLISKVTKVTLTEAIKESVSYEYDLRGKLRKVTTTPYSGGSPGDSAVVEYSYDSSGNRIRKLDLEIAQATYYLVDESNHTGYSQVLEERSFIIAGGTETLDAAVYYTIGDDVLSQTKAGYVGGVWTVCDTQYLLYDGHGSTRQLLSHTLSSGEPIVTESYDYDAYGVMLGSGTNPKPADSAATNLLYSGEQYDSSLSQYYLRARYYDHSNGRFTSVDPYGGNNQDPQSLHKYTYCHNDPVNGIDPTGKTTLTSLLVGTSIKAIFISAIVGGAIRQAFYYIRTPASQWTVTGGLSEFAKGAALGAFGATLIGGIVFAIQGIYQGLQVWLDPNSSALQKALASVMILISIVSSYFLGSQVKSAYKQWQTMYSQVPLSMQVQTELSAIRSAFDRGDDAITLGTRTIRFADKAGSAGGIVGGYPNEFYLTAEAFNKGDDYLMKTILEENFHLWRVSKGAVNSGAAYAGMESVVKAEEAYVATAVDDIFEIGRANGWW